MTMQKPLDLTPYLLENGNVQSHAWPGGLGVRSWRPVDIVMARDKWRQGPMTMGAVLMMGQIIAPANIATAKGYVPKATVFCQQPSHVLESQCNTAGMG